METIGSNQAFPMPETEFEPARDGLTKREHFAALALQGLLADHGSAGAAYQTARAVEFADALIEALNA